MQSKLKVAGKTTCYLSFKHPLSGESTFSPRETVPKTRVLFPGFIVSRFPGALFKLCIVMIMFGFFFRGELSSM